MMNVLFVCHRFPYPTDGGGKIRARQIIEHLARHHRVHVVSMTRTAEEVFAAKRLAQQGIRVHAPRVGWLQTGLGLVRSLLSARSLSEGYFGPPGLAATAARVARDDGIDAIVVHCSSVGALIEGVHGVPTVLDYCDVDSDKWRLYALESKGLRRLMYAYEAWAVRRLERRLAARFEVTTVATPAERKLLERVAEPRRSAWFPNGVDCVYFRPPKDGYDPDTACFVGRMDYLPNIDAVEYFCLTVWPAIRAVRPNARFVIIGAQPHERVRALASVAGVVVTGTVDDVRLHLGRAAVMVAPLRIARGVQNKLLEAMAMGVPVVTSSLAAAGVDAVPGVHLTACDDPRDVAAATLKCMSDADHRRGLSVRGRRLVRSRYAWSSCMRKLDAILADAIQVGASGARAAPPDAGSSDPLRASAPDLR